MKQWLRRKTQGFLGASTLQAQVQAIAEICGQMSRLAAENNALLSRLVERLETFGQPIDPSAAAVVDAQPVSASTAPIEARRAIERQGLFIFGCARSGTTILMKSLNRSHEIFLLAEPNLAFYQHASDLAAYLNKLHVGNGSRRIKGNYLAPAISDENGPLDSLLRLARDYRYIGEKTAIGPGDYPPDWQQLYLDFHGKYFQRGRYIIIVRRPVESIWSMSKLFPGSPTARLFRAWLESASLVLNAYHVFPDSRVVFFEDLGDAMIGRLAQWLEIPVPIVAGTFGNNYVRSAVADNDLPEVLLPFVDLCREATRLYRDLRESFSNEEHVYRGSASEWAFFDARWREVGAMLSRLAAVDGEEGKWRRAA